MTCMGNTHLSLELCPEVFPRTQRVRCLVMGGLVSSPPPHVSQATVLRNLTVTLRELGMIGESGFFFLSFFHFQMCVCMLYMFAGVWTHVCACMRMSGFVL